MSAKQTTKSKGFTAEERAAMKERAKELKAEERMNKDRAAGESALLEKVAEMPKADRELAERIHALASAHYCSATAERPGAQYDHMPSFGRRNAAPRVRVAGIGTSWISDIVGPCAGG